MPPPNLPAFELWSFVFIALSAVLLFIPSAIIIIIYIFNKRFREVVGTVILFHAFSCLCLSICWIYTLTPFAFQNESLHVAFITLFCIYTCIFYKIGLTWYFWCYIKAKSGFSEVQVIRRGGDDELREFQPPGPQTPLLQANEFPDFPQRVIQRQNTIGRNFEKLETGYSLLARNDRRLIKKLKKLKRSIQGAPLQNIESKIIACALIAACCLTISYSLLRALGVGLFGDWSIAWDDAVQNLGVIACVFIGGFDLIISCFALLYYRAKKFRKKLKNLRDNEHLTQEEKQANYYLKHLPGFIIIMTILNCFFLAANVYPNQATEMEIEEWEYVFWKVIYFLSPALQSFFVLRLKIAEPK